MCLVVCRPPLPLGQRGDELAAEGRDVRDDAAPDRVEGGRKTWEQGSERPLVWRKTRCSTLLVCSRVWREAREESEAVVTLPGQGILSLG